MEVGGWVQVSLEIFFFENHPKIALNQYRYFGVVYTLCILSVVSYYDLSVLSKSVMVSKKKKFGWGWVGGVSSIQVFLDFWNFFNFAKPLI